MELPSKVLTNVEINSIVKELDIPNYIGTLMSDELSGHKPNKNVCGVINLQPHSMQGSHWTSFAIFGPKSYYFDSYGIGPPNHVTKYLKTINQYKNDTPTIHCNATVVQHTGNTNCGALSIFVLYYLSQGVDYDHILRYLYHHRLNPSLWISKNHLPQNGKCN